MSTTGLKDLPVELLYSIHLLALSPSFPLASLHLYNTLHNTTATFKAQYLIYKVLRDHLTRWDCLLSRNHKTRHLEECLSVMLRYPVCSPTVLDVVLRELEVEFGDWLERDEKRRGDIEIQIELPRRLFRSLTAPAKPQSTSPSPHQWIERSPPLPFLRYLVTKQTSLSPTGFLHIKPNSHEGYALIRAVHAQFIPLIRFLLDQGASPIAKDGLAVLIAIRNRDLSMTKMLIERHEQQRMGTMSGRGKKRKLEDRTAITPEMLKAAIRCDARDIVDYFMNEKGCVPDLAMLRLVKGGKRVRK